jgi:hypothetical protein
LIDLKKTTIEDQITEIIAENLIIIVTMTCGISLGESADRQIDVKVKAMITAIIARDEEERTRKMNMINIIMLDTMTVAREES